MRRMMLRVASLILSSPPQSSVSTRTRSMKRLPLGEDVEVCSAKRRRREVTADRLRRGFADCLIVPCKRLASRLRIHRSISCLIDTHAATQDQPKVAGVDFLAENTGDLQF